MMTFVGEERLASQEQRIVDATLRCIARWGVAKTTLDDVAREASCSRATVYRLFPGGKEAVLAAVATTELEAFLGRVGSTLADAPSLEAALVGAIAETGRTLAGHGALR